MNSLDTIGKVIGDGGHPWKSAKLREEFGKIFVGAHQKFEKFASDPKIWKTCEKWNFLRMWDWA
jgi:hypothetical protein